MKLCHNVCRLESSHCKTNNISRWHLHDQGGILDVHWELVGVPAEVRGASVGVNGAQHAQLGGHYHVVLMTVTSQRGVVGLNVQLGGGGGGGGGRRVR